MQLLKLKEPMDALNKRIDSTAERISELEINFLKTIQNILQRNKEIENKDTDSQK